MPAHLFIIGLVAALGGLAAALDFWPRIREWCERSLFVWLERNLPRLAPRVRGAFATIDNAVTTVRRIVAEAWQRLREHLLHQILTLERRSSSQWVRRVTSWIVMILDNAQPVPVQVVTEEPCSWEELPAEVRARWLRQCRDQYEIDVTKLRDQELATY